MDIEGLIILVAQYGYGALFFFLWLGIVGMPIPDEVIVMTGGFVSSLHLLKPVPAFLVTYLGVISGLTIGYVLGFNIGAPIVARLLKNKNMNKGLLSKSYGLIDRYGSYALCISYFFPVIRHLVPYLVGISRMSYKRYVLFSYTTGLAWTFLFFTVGRFFGTHIEEIGEIIHSYGICALLILLSVWLGYWFIHQYYRNQSNTG